MNNKSKSGGVLAIACILIACIVPVENGTKAENEITPASTILFSELGLINKKVIEEEIELTPQLSDSSDDKSQINVDTAHASEPVETSKEIDPTAKNGRHIKKHHTRKNKRIPLPVCKYGMREIFLFEPTGDILMSETVKNVTTVDYVEPNKEKDAATDILLPVVVVPEKKEMDENLPDSESGKKKEEALEDDMKLKVADMHSFEEWKSLKLQEQESRLAKSEPTPTRTVRAKKTQVNYASQDCGAKVLAHNKEAKHVAAVLDENRDLYMLNPCSNPIWFVVELCEPIQVQQIQLGNLELFSSAPKEFTVSVSERYPSRDWQSIGTFEATNERTLQTFGVKSNNVMFAKYIKFEMKSHFSNEHFCPLTLVRVLGISMVDEFDESEQRMTKDDGDDDVNAECSHESAAQDDNGAINAMLNMVKNAMGLNENAQITAEGNKEVQDNDTEAIDPTAESEVTLVTNQTEIAGPPTNNTNLITLIETGKGEDLTMYIQNLTSYSPRIPLCVPKFIQYLSPVTQKLNARVCWFLEFFCKVSLASCLVHYPFNYSAIGVFIPFSVISLDFPVDTVLTDDVKDTDIDNPPEVDLSEAPAKDISLVSNSVSTDSQDDVGSTSIMDEHLTMGQPSTVVEDDVPNGKPTPLDETESTKLVSEEPVLVERDVIDAREPNHSEQEMKKMEIKKAENITKSSNSSTDDVKTDPVAHGSTSEEKSNATTGVKEGNTTHPETYTKQINNESTAEKQHGQTTVVMNPSNSQKDSVFMRMSNRIRMLEQNMSLSSDYLESLSRRYKEQMDEMQRAFNQTTLKLVATGRTANENDAKQTELIKQAQAEIEILKQQVQNLSTAHDQLNMKLVERHLCLIILEFIIFIAVFITCLGRRIGQTQRNLEKADAMIKQLKYMVEDLKNSKASQSTTSNGHCRSIPVQNSEQSGPPNTGNSSKPGKKKKRLKRKNSSELAPARNDEPRVSSNNYTDCRRRSVGGVEEIGSQMCGPAPPCMPNPSHDQDNTKVWNEGQLGLSIHETCVKGRK